jgi:hypothetical protein
MQKSAFAEPIGFSQGDFARSAFCEIFVFPQSFRTLDVSEKRPCPCEPSVVRRLSHRSSEITKVRKSLLLVVPALVLLMSGAASAQKGGNGNGNGGTGNGNGNGNAPVAAPELSASVAATALALVGGGVMMLRKRKR